MIHEFIATPLLIITIVVSMILIMVTTFDVSNKKKYSVGDIIEFQERDKPIKTGIIVTILKATKYYKPVGKVLKEDSQICIYYFVSENNRRLDTKNIEIDNIKIKEEDIIRKVV